jgi:hypothetical protein
LLAIVKATFATNAVSKGGGIAMLAGIGLHGVEPVGAGKSAEVAAGAGLSFLRYCHSGADNRLKLREIPILFPVFPNRVTAPGLVRLAKLGQKAPGFKKYMKSKRFYCRKPRAILPIAT